MKRIGIVLALACIGLCAMVVRMRADDHERDQALRARLVGTWRASTMKFGGQESDLTKSAVTYKHVTPAGFMWLSHEKGTGKVFRAAGGTYSLKSGIYTETIEYGMGDDYEVIKNARIPFDCKVEGDKWYHKGKLNNGTTIDEVWERVKPNEAEQANNRRSERARK